MKMREFVEQVLMNAEAPLSYKQIWAKGCELGLDKELAYKGKTDPWLTIYSSISQDITANEDSIFCRFSSNPVLFGLKQKDYGSKAREAVENAINDEAQTGKKDETIIEDDNDYSEADLHVPLVSYLASDAHFKCLTKTIAQQKAKRAEKKGLDNWTYPDLIGVYFPYNKGDYDDWTLKALQNFKINAVQVYSFEVKKSLNSSDIRQCYFQAVSNSSWANEGYLVAAEISDEEAFNQELNILNNAFGIGIIKLDIEDPSRSSILLPARHRENIEINVLNKLITRSDQVKAIFKSIDNSEKISEIANREIYDRIYSYDEYSEQTQDGKKLKGISGRKK